MTGHDGLTRLVAVKSIKETASQKEKQELLHEINIMQKIGTHPNVVTILACCTEQGNYFTTETLSLNYNNIIMVNIVINTEP